MKTLAVITMLVISYYSSQFDSVAQTVSRQPDTDLQKKALTVLVNKCNVCHRTRNPRKVFTNDNMSVFAPKIYKQVFVKRRMPKGDEVKLTAEEEQTLRSWLQTQKVSGE